MEAPSWIEPADNEQCIFILILCISIIRLLLILVYCSMQICTINYAFIADS